MAKEHGLEEHKGKTIPKEVKSLADRIRKKDPSATDEYAYRTAWDIFRSHTPEGKSYPNKSPESGLAREGGGTGPLSKHAFWQGFEKAAASTWRSLLPSTKKFKPQPAPIGMPSTTQKLKNIAPAADPLNYKDMFSSEELARQSYLKPPKPAVLDYSVRGKPKYTKASTV